MSAHDRLRSALQSAACRITFLAVPFALTTPGLAQSYTITDLGTLGGTSSFATDISIAGEIVGLSYTTQFPSISAAFLWEDGEMVNIGPLGNDSNDTWAYGINVFGVIGGYGETQDFHDRAYRWQNGRMTELDTLGSTTRAYAINIFGDIVGFSTPDGSSASHAVMWIDEEITDLGVLVPGHSTYARGINDCREVVGWGYGEPSGVRGFHWQDGIMFELPTLGGEDSSASGISDSGWIVGSANTSSEQRHPVVWLFEAAPAITIIDLGLPEEFDFGFGRAVNNIGVVVGMYWEILPGRKNYNICPFVWEDGRMQLLDELIPPDSGWDLDFAMAVNDAGQIVGAGIAPNGELHGFLLTPISPGDIDHDGDVDVTDLLLLLGAWGPCADCGDCLADLDDDCAVGVTDLLILLGNWG